MLFIFTDIFQMLETHIQSIIKTGLGYPATSDQDELIRKLASFISFENSFDVFLIKGYAGTGKTTVISALVRALEQFTIRTVLLAPTGRAAKVLASYTKKNAFTIHKKIYRQKTSTDGFGEFRLDRNLHTDTLFIVDEASMISDRPSETSVFGSGRLLDDLIEYVFSGKRCRLILIGDTAQLPPVGLDISHALKKKVLENYLLSIDEAELKQVVRQSEESGILCNATYVRTMIDTEQKNYPRFSIRNFTDIIRITGAELMEAISDAYDRYGLNETIVITRSNKRANRFNLGIRNQILWREEEISIGDFLMIVKNNYFWLPENERTDFIANGDIAEIIRVHRYEERYGFRFADLLIRLCDYDELEFEVKIVLDALTTETPALTTDENKRLFYAISEDYQEITGKRERFEQIRKNPYLNALQVKFAYAVTCHKAQGGQWKVAFVDQGYLTKDMLNTEYLRWLYTALTRPVEKLFLVNFSREFFKDGEIPEWE